MTFGSSLYLHRSLLRCLAWAFSVPCSTSRPFFCLLYFLSHTRSLMFLFSHSHLIALSLSSGSLGLSRLPACTYATESSTDYLAPGCDAKLCYSNGMVGVETKVGFHHSRCMAGQLTRCARRASQWAQHGPRLSLVLC